MKKYFTLILKDLVLMKNYVIFTAVIIVVMPLLLVGLGSTAFTATYMFALYSTAQSLAYYEAKYRGAETVLNSAPYSRQSIVISRYVFYLLVYAVTLAIYAAMSLIIPPLTQIGVVDMAVALFAGSVLTGFLQPLNYKFGINKTRYISVFVMVCIGIAFPFIADAVEDGNAVTDFIGKLSPALVGGLTLLLTVIIYVASAIISVAVYKKKEF